MPFAAGMDCPKYSLSTGPEVHVWTDEEFERLQKALQQVFQMKQATKIRKPKMIHSTLRQHLGDKNIMAIDFETLDLTETAVALSCGIVIFNAVTGETVLETEVLLDVDQQIRQGRTMSGSTLKWWIDQAMTNPEAAKAAFGFANVAIPDPNTHMLDMQGFAESVAQTYEEFSCQWITACGVQFDVKLLENLMKQCGVVPPWRHNQVFDQRTLYLLNQNNIPKDLGREKGVAHRAKDDAAWVRDYILAVCSYEEEITRGIRATQTILETRPDLSHLI